ncbi:MAG: LamG domain-containing protein, partial [Bdellovibrionota bacterium]|nr:LamG domain-containing protein [Bdellovibrionota bacterium]
ITHNITPVAGGLNAPATNHTSSDYTVIAAAPTQILALMPGETLVEGSGSLAAAKAGGANDQDTDNDYSVRVYAVDNYFNVSTNYNTGNVSITTGSDPTDTNPSSKTFSSGLATFTVSSVTAVNSAVITVGNDQGLTNNVSTNYNILPGAPSQWLVKLPGESINEGQTSLGSAIGGAASAQQSGQAFNVEVFLTDAEFNVVDNDSQSVSLSTSDTADTDPSAATLTDGKATLSVTNVTVGSGHTITPSGGAYSANVSNSYVVSAGSPVAIIARLPGQTHNQPAVNLGAAITGPESVGDVDSDFNVELIAVDANYNKVTTYSSASNSVSVSTPNDSKDTEPSASQFVNGSATFTISPVVAGATNVINVSNTLGLANNNSSNYGVDPGASTHLLVELPGESFNPGSTSITGVIGSGATAQVAGTSFTAKVHLVDAEFNLVDDDTSVVSLVSNDANDTDPVDVTLSDGTGSFSVTNHTAGTGHILSPSLLGKTPHNSNTYAVNPGAASKLLVGLPSQSHNPGLSSGAISGPAPSQVSGASFSVTIYATDAYSNIITTDSSSVISISSSDSNDIEPANETLSSGVASFNIDPVASGSGFTVTASRVSGSVYSDGTSDAYVVDPGAPTQLIVRLPGQTHVQPAANLAAALTGSETVSNVDSDFNVEVIAVDANFNKVSTYSSGAGTVSISTPNDSVDTEPSAGAFSSGSANFTVSPVQAGATNVVNVTNSLGLANNSSSNYAIDPGAATQLIVEMPGQSFNPGQTSLANAISNAVTDQVAGTGFSAKVHLVDAEFNLVDDDSSVVSLSSNDIYDTEPADITLSDGSADFTVVNQYAGSSHVLTPGLVGKSINASTSYNVNAGAAAKMVVLLPGQTLTAGPSTETIVNAAPDQASGTSFTARVVATDAYYNTISTDSSSVIAITSSDSADSHPANETLVNGIATFSLTPVTSGSNFNLSASVVSGGSYGTDTSANYDVNPGSLAHILALLPGDSLNSPAASAAAAVTNAGYNPTAGSSFDVTLKAVDSNFNLISTYNSAAYIRWTASGASNAADSPNESPSVPANASRTFSSGSVTISNAVTLYNTDDTSANIQVEYCSDGAACSSIVSTHSTGTMAVSAAALDYIQVLDAASNAGSVFPSQDESTATTSIAMYAAGYDNYGNYLGDQTATWQATRSSAGDLDAALSATSGTNITFDPSTADVGTASVTATVSGKSDTTGTFNILDQGASQYDVELASVGDKTSGTGFAVTITARKPDNSVATDYSGTKTITWSNSASNGDTTCTAGPHAPVEASTTLSFTNGVATTAASFIMKKAESGVSITATSASNSALTDSTSSFNVVAGSENCNLLRTAAANAGALLSDQTLSFDSTFSAYLASYDQYGNYIEDKSVAWTGTGIASFVSETTSAFDFTAHQQGTGTISAGGESINITVNNNGSGTLWTNSSSDHDGKTILGSTNAQIVKVWDVSSDAVNAWRTAGTQSWYSESSSATRGVRQDFPAKALLVATASGIDVIDMQENRLFLRFDYSSGYALDSGMGSIQDIEAINGKMIVSIGNGSSNALLVIVDFANDNIYHIKNSSAQILSGGVENRNIAGSWSGNGTYSNLANASLGKIDVARVSGSDYLAYATASGVYVMSLSGGSVYGDSTGDMDDVALDSNGKLYYYENGVGLNRADLSLPLGGAFSASRTYSGASSAKILEMNVDSIAIAEGESSADSGQNRVVIAGSRGIASVDEHSTAASSNASSYSRQGSGNTGFDNYLNFDSASFTAADKSSRPTTAFTIEFFFKPDELLNTTDSDMTLFKKGDGSAEEDYGIRFNGSTGKIEFYATHDNTGLAEVTVASSASSWNQGQWYHVAAVLNAGDMKLWIDGTYQGNAAILSTGWTGNTNAPEWAANASSEYFKGALDEFRLTSDARYTGTSSISVPSAEFTSDGTTVYLYHFDESNGTTVTDSSSSAANGTSSGDAVFVKTWASGSTQAVSSIKSVGSGANNRMSFISNGSFYQWNPSSNTVDETISESGIKDAELYYYNSSTDSHKAFVGTSGLRIISE